MQNSDGTMYDIHLLRTFLAVADAKHFTAGGVSIGLSQATVSQHIRRLETLCGRQLLSRDTHSVSLTTDGAVMAAFARDMLEVNKQAADYFAGAAPRGKVRLGVSDDLAVSRLSRILRGLIAANPLLNVELTVGLTGMLHQKLDAGRLDLVFAKRMKDDDRGRLIRRERLVWLAQRDFMLGADEPVPLVMYPSGSITTALALESLNRAGRSWYVACSSETLNGIRAGTESGLGLTAQSPLLLQSLDGDLVLAPDSAGLPELGEIEFVVLGRSAKLHGATAVLADLIEAEGPGLWSDA
ncbi:MAG: LysR substrate-binding domain-containing protein [Caulobacteraceae bacterium]